eukprot:TRINITY_DN10129_c0_g2_i1.p1 TRINITY_DN10129_c0_g2~~TRINITY_DN10129_c0_g2_i1.p1  ORF type:complete len:414 (+),score=93.43 TRINITY_DN10129_c0_g2_i1:44-1285(+)
MDGVPSRGELQGLPLPDLLKVAQQLGVDITHVHDRSEVIDALISHRRAALGRYAEELQKFKIKLEAQHQEMELAKKQYQTTYDNVEQAVIDRFAQMHDQLLRKEIEVRGQMAYLRNNGDEVIADCSSEMEREIAILQEQLDRCTSRDVDILEIAPRTEPTTVTVPSLIGRCFEFNDIGNLDLSGLSVSLDMHTSSRSLQMIPPGAKQNNNNQQYQSYGGGGHQNDSWQGGGGGGGGGRYSQQQSSMYQNPSAGGNSGVDFLSFPPDQSLEQRQGEGGLSLRNVDTSTTVVGTKANEIFSDGFHVWKVRLDNIQGSLVGMIDASNMSHTVENGFFWSPIRRDVLGRIGRAASTVSQIPICKNGDILKFSFDAAEGTLRVAHNGADRGLLCTGLRDYQLSPCFVFSGGEGVTVLQ